MEGHPKDQEKATAQFLAWLSKPVVAAEWHQRTGYLPLTEAAFRASDVVLQEHSRSASRDRFHERPSVRQQPRLPHGELHAYEPVLNQQLTDAFEGKTRRWPR